MKTSDEINIGDRTYLFYYPDYYKNAKGFILVVQYRWRLANNGTGYFMDEIARFRFSKPLNK